MTILSTTKVAEFTSADGTKIRPGQIWTDHYKKRVFVVRYAYVRTYDDGPTTHRVSGCLVRDRVVEHERNLTAEALRKGFTVLLFESPEAAQ